MAIRGVFAAGGTLVIIITHIISHHISTTPKVWSKGGRVVDGLVFQRCFAGLLLHLFASLHACSIILHYPEI